LTIDLVPARVNVDPGCWRFNPTLLVDNEFLVLMDKTVALFFKTTSGVDDSGVCGGGEPMLAQNIWESFKI
jgi:hypothetical protein